MNLAVGSLSSLSSFLFVSFNKTEFTRGRGVCGAGDSAGCRTRSALGGIGICGGVGINSRQRSPQYREGDIQSDVSRFLIDPLIDGKLNYSSLTQCEGESIGMSEGDVVASKVQTRLGSTILSTVQEGK